MDLFLFVVLYVIFGFPVANPTYGLTHTVKSVCDVHY